MRVEVDAAAKMVGWQQPTGFERHAGRHAELSLEMASHGFALTMRKSVYRGATMLAFNEADMRP